MTPKRIQFNGSELVDQETGKELAQMYAYSDGSHNDVAKRMVACWNACEGISTEALESAGNLWNGWKLASYAMQGAIKQRDELLAALHGLLAITRDSQGVAGYHKNGDVAVWDEFDEVNAALAVIAKVGGGAA